MFPDLSAVPAASVVPAVPAAPAVAAAPVALPDQPRHPRPAHPLRPRATAWLLAATILWALSFPLAKALFLLQNRLIPGADGWFLVAVSLVFRFGLAAVATALGTARTWGTLTRKELSQGVALGLFAAGGMLLQMDGLNYTAASTSAFLTSCYCVIIPVIVAVQRRRLPPVLVVGCCALVLVGMGVLAGIDWRTLRLGRGEWETIACSSFFAGQIFWLERPAYAANRTGHTTAIMFATLALIALPVALGRAGGAGPLVAAVAGTPAIFALLLALTLFCTLTTFSLMNHWQKYLEATEAGLIYCAEPVWTSLFSLCLPGWLALWTGVAYANERATLPLLVGGGLITLANVCLQLRPRAVTPV